ncbi:MAG: glucose-6-phosphate dehydrogenase [Candidatus Eisenbacteria bacterium]|uniref:Glucose-6-phosphate 1-dehydrogenase n=1 Tax=Eiseniibacteriota bacterium TaxID=2212470 RepID=A0A849SYS7_UNCEI|nr:glucose-6-phosphate dehydrogenase [Candidatus Eisenbacteria bacterium]
MTTQIEVTAAQAVAALKPNPAPPCAVVVFGATGDLTRRKLLPALYNLQVSGALPEHFVTLGVARRPLTDEQFRTDMRAACDEFSRRKPDAATWEGFAGRIDYVAADFSDPAGFERLSMRLQQLDFQHGLEGNRLFYLATPPSEFEVILRGLRSHGLLLPPGGEGPWSRVIIEKPFGRDLASARALNTLVSEVLDESQTFRIDHYLGKETVQNILVMRFANSIFEPLWNRKYVAAVEISALETVGVGTRGAFYDQYGVMRDVVQNHLLELVALTAMEPPTSGSADDVRSEKLKVLNALRDGWDDTVSRDVVLGQYDGYRAEKDVAPDSFTPTYAALRLFVDNWRWQGVPFYLRAGKKLAKRATEISVHLQPIPLSLFGRHDVCESVPPNVLTIRVQPDEGVQLQFASKIPGEDTRVGRVLMDMRYQEAFGGEPPEAYERLLLDAMRGDATLFSRRDWVETSWSWIDPLLQYFDRHPPTDFPNYAPASWGPKRADEWIARDRRAWRCD